MTAGPRVQGPRARGHPSGRPVRPGPLWRCATKGRARRRPRGPRAPPTPVGRRPGGVRRAVPTLLDGGLRARLPGDRPADPGPGRRHDAFMALWRAPEAFDPARGAFRTFFLSLVHHRAVDTVRREERLRKRQERATNLEPVDSEDVAEEVVDEAWLAIRRREVREALTTSPRNNDRCSRWPTSAERPRWQIAEELGIPLGTVKTRTLAAMRKLRRALGPGGRRMSEDHEQIEELLAGYVLRSALGRGRHGGRPAALRSRAGVRRVPRHPRRLPGGLGRPGARHAAARAARDPPAPAPSRARSPCPRRRRTGQLVAVAASVALVAGLGRHAALTRSSYGPATGRPAPTTWRPRSIWPAKPEADLVPVGAGDGDLGAAGSEEFYLYGTGVRRRHRAPSTGCGSCRSTGTTYARRASPTRTASSSWSCRSIRARSRICS